jgi:glutaminyl-tRNA synthetase
VEPRNFIEEIVAADIDAGVYSRPITTRFPPEPGGYLHIGHAKGIIAAYSVAKAFDGYFNLRLDDTDPEKHYGAYVDIVIEDVRSLGIDLGDRVFFTSDYFARLYEYAEELVRRGKAFVCDLSEEELRDLRGDFHRPGRPSPYRDRTVEENLELFRGMQAGRDAPGTRVLRAKIDPNHPNVLMRDPVIYRVLDHPHYRTGRAWNVYPRYDFAHCLSDAIEGVTHSTCGKEFEVHHDLYDWFLRELDIPEPPKQIEYAELHLSHTILGKRHIRRLIDAGIVKGWDDPSLMTIRGMLRRGYTPAIIHDFFRNIGISKTHSLIDMRVLDNCARERYNREAERRMAVLRPLRVVIENYPEEGVADLSAVNNPEDPDAGSRLLPFGRELYIERDDFAIDPPRKFHRLAPGREVRLRYGYLVTCTRFELDPGNGEASTVYVTLDPETRGGSAPDGRKVRGTIHWVAARSAVSIEVRLYDRITTVADPASLVGEDELPSHLPSDGVETVRAFGEPSLAAVEPGQVVQFERLGYFTRDSASPHARKDNSRHEIVFNRLVALRDTWAKIQAKEPRRRR